MDVGRQFGAIERSFWGDEKVRSLTDDGRLLFVYLLTCDAGSLEGFYHLSRGAMADDLDWSPDRLTETLEGLKQAGLVDYDARARVVLIVRALKYHGPMRQERVVKAALKDVVHVHGSRRLFARFLEAADRYRPDFAAAIRAHYSLPDGPYEAAE